jgi:oligopeptide/dipeptide ABC transporter ATP-binding protein
MSSDAGPTLEVEDLHVRFAYDAAGIDVVRGVGFSLYPGQTLSLVGESGCGKSMTALAVMGLTPPGGRVAGGGVRLFDGNRHVDLLRLPDASMRHIRGRVCAMIFQEPMTSLNPVLRIGDQVAEPLLRHERLSRAEGRARAERALAEVGIPAAAHRMRDYPHQLSGGMRQRVMIAMALICGPRLLLADEPTTALDVTIQGQILELLLERTANSGMSMLLITHDLSVVAEAADAVGVMYAGEIVELARVAELFAHPLHPYTWGLMDAIPTRHAPRGTRLATISGAVPSPGDVPPGCTFAPRCARAMPVCRRERPPATVDSGHRVSCWLHAGGTVRESCPRSETAYTPVCPASDTNSESDQRIC